METTKKIWEKANKIAGDNKQLKDTFEKAGDKLKRLTEHSEELKGLKQKLEMLLRMIKAHISGNYRSFPLSTLVLIAFALIYFIVPFDVIPDFIPALGLTDDVSVVFLISKKVNRDIERFRQWEEDQWEQAD